MLKFTLISVAVILSAARVSQTKISYSLLREIAMMMEDPVKEVSRCGLRCCVEIEGENGEKETRVLELGQSVPSPRNSCEIYRCEEEGINLVVIDTCQNRTCKDGKKPVQYPGQCCLKCTGDNTEGGCSFTEWSDFGPCSVTCDGVGEQVRVRRLDAIAGSGVDIVNCTGNLTEIRQCVAPPCPVDCEWKTVEVGECLPDCAGGGVIERYYVITQQPDNGGRPCPRDVLDNVTEVEECCQNCKWERREKGVCLPFCSGGGFKEIYYVITQPAAGDGEKCPDFVHENVTETVECCENCTWEYRTTECSASCDGGTNVTYTVIIKPAKGDGHCPDFVLKNETTTEECNKQPCEPCEFEECEIDGVIKCIDPIDDPDKDCIPTDEDNCPNTHNPDQNDMDNDGIGDVCDDCNMTAANGPVDRDYDGVEDGCDNCPQHPNSGQENSDDDETGNACDPDDDNDGIRDPNDNCLIVANPDQKDLDRDEIGDACDNCKDKPNKNQADKDEDGVGNACDNCRFVPNEDQTDSDGDGVGDACESRAQYGYPDDHSYDFGYEHQNLENEDEKGLLARIMEKLLELYYSK